MIRIVDLARYREMEARAELLLANAFRRNDMDCEDDGMKTKTEKDFAVIVKTLTGCKQKALQLVTRSGRLASSLAGKTETQKEESEKLQVDSVVLIHVLRDIGSELNQSLSEISDNLEKLENAW